MIFDKKENIFLKFTKTLFSVLVFIILIRGGIQEIPINTSDAYFSDKLIVNDVTVNPNWNFFQSILKSKNNLNGNPYEKYSNTEAINFINSMHENNYDTSSVLTNSKPNIIFILLESWSADNIESFGGLKGITPNFSQLCNQGLSFTNFYSNGWTSDQAMTSIFSSFPVFPYASIINQTDKSRKLPCLNKSLDSLGYNSSFFFGGQLTYGNIKGFLLSQSFDLVKDENNYSSLKSGRLGVHDEYMFSQFKKELSKINKQGYAFDDEEWFNGMVGLSLPITNSNNELCFCLSTHTAKSRKNIDGLKKILPLMLSAAANLKKALFKD